MILLTYDLSSNHSQVKDVMKSLGYFDSWTVGGTPYNLPNTTLFNPNGTTQADADRAVADLRFAVSKTYGTTLGRVAAVVFSIVSAA